MNWNHVAHVFQCVSYDMKMHSLASSLHCRDMQFHKKQFIDFVDTGCNGSAVVILLPVSGNEAAAASLHATCVQGMLHACKHITKKSEEAHKLLEASSYFEVRGFF